MRKILDTIDIPTSHKNIIWKDVRLNIAPTPSRVALRIASFLTPVL